MELGEDSCEAGTGSRTKVGAQATQLLKCLYTEKILKSKMMTSQCNTEDSSSEAIKYP